MQPISDGMFSRFFALAACCFFLVLFGCTLTGCDEGGRGTLAPDSTAIDTVPEVVYDRYWNDLARWFGGLEPLPGSKLTMFDTTATARANRTFWNERWQHKDTILFAKLRTWAQQEFPREHQDTGIAFYPLSGSDFMTLYQFFPRANRYVFFAWEPEGIIPDSAFMRTLSTREADHSLESMQEGLAELFRLSFLITSYMQRDVVRARLNGHLPAFMAFLARTGNEVLNVQPLVLDANAQPRIAAQQPRSFDPRDSVVSGIRYTFRRERGAPVQTLDFWCIDIEHKWQSRYPQWLTYLRSLKHTRTYFKAASYLMHYDEYPEHQAAILDVSDFILQDDSGFPYRVLKAGPWDVTLYGKYLKPKLEVWGGFQADLKRAYDSGEGIRPIPFGLGYTNRDDNCNLHIARKRPGNVPGSAGVSAR